MNSPTRILLLLVVCLVISNDVARIIGNRYGGDADAELRLNSTANNTQHHNHSLFDDSSTIYAIQAADEAYAAKMKTKIEVNKKWANCTGYTYKLITLTNTGNVYSQKVKAIYDTLESAKENDWVIFLDGDVHYQLELDSCNALEKILPLESEQDEEPCEFVAMTSKHTINTGVVLFKQSENMLKLLHRWLELQQKPDNLLSFGAADQLTLQEAVLEKFLGQTYTGKCGSEGSQAGRNYCFRDHLPQEYRSAQNVCLVPCHSKQPLQCNDCGEECNRTAAPFFHDSKRERHIAKHGFG